MSSSMNFGTCDRAAHSAERSRTCCSVGTSPVKRSQKSPALISTAVRSGGFKRWRNLPGAVLPRRELLVIISGTLGSRSAFSHDAPRNSFDVLMTDGLSSKPDTFFRIQYRSLILVNRLADSRHPNCTHLPHEGFNATGTTVYLIEGNLSDDC